MRAEERGGVFTLKGEEGVCLATGGRAVWGLGDGPGVGHASKALGRSGDG